MRRIAVCMCWLRRLTTRLYTSIIRTRSCNYTRGIHRIRTRQKPIHHKHLWSRRRPSLRLMNSFSSKERRIDDEIVGNLRSRSFLQFRRYVEDTVYCMTVTAGEKTKFPSGGCHVVGSRQRCQAIAMSWSCCAVAISWNTYFVLWSRWTLSTRWSCYAVAKAWSGSAASDVRSCFAVACHLRCSALSKIYSFSDKLALLGFRKSSHFQIAHLCIKSRYTQLLNT